MNANELADKYENRECWTGADIDEWCDEAATMLRQLQAENEALKSGIEKLKDAYCERDNTVRQQQEQIEVMISILEQEGIGVGRDLLNGGIALFRKAQEK